MTARKPSWEIAELAWKIETPALSTKLLLAFLGSRSNDRGECWHGDKSIKQHTGLSTDSINRAKKYLRDELKILDWKQGGGSLSNRYKFDLSTMRTMVERQRTVSKDSDGAGGTPPTVGNLQDSDGAAYPSDGAEQVSDGAAIPPAQSERNPHRTLIEPTKKQPRPSGLFFEVHSNSENEDMSRSAEHSDARARATALGQCVSGTVPQAPLPTPVHDTQSAEPPVIVQTGQDPKFIERGTGRMLPYIEAKRLMQERGFEL